MYCSAVSMIQEVFQRNNRIHISAVRSLYHTLLCSSGYIWACCTALLGHKGVDASDETIAFELKALFGAAA